MMLQKIGSSLSIPQSLNKSPMRTTGSPTKRTPVMVDLVVSITLVSIKRVVAGKVYSLLGLAANGRIVEIITFSTDVITAILEQITAIVSKLGQVPFAWFHFRSLSIKSPSCDASTALEFMFEMVTSVSLGVSPGMKLFSFENVSWPRMSDGDSMVKLSKYNIVLVPLVLQYEL